MGESAEAARIESNIAALDSLLPLLEAHLDKHGSIVPKARWESEYEPPPKGYVPPPPEPDCEGDCLRCHDFWASRCTLREEGWAAEWARLWGKYPELEVLDDLMKRLNLEKPHWGSALYWTYVQPWDAFERTRREAWATEGVKWLAKECNVWLPTYVPKGLPAPDPVDKLKRKIVELRVQKGLSHAAIGREAGCHKSYVGKVLAALKIR